MQSQGICKSNWTTGFPFPGFPIAKKRTANSPKGYRGLSASIFNLTYGTKLPTDSQDNLTRKGRNRQDVQRQPKEGEANLQVLASTQNGDFSVQALVSGRGSRRVSRAFTPRCSKSYPLKQANRQDCSRQTVYARAPGTGSLHAIASRVRRRRPFFTINRRGLSLVSIAIKPAEKPLAHFVAHSKTEGGHK